MDRETLHKFFLGESSREEDGQVLDWAESNRAGFETERGVFDAMIFAELPVRKRRRWVGELLRTAAVLVIAVGAWWVLRDEGEPSEMAISVPVGQQLKVTLPDGSSVVVNGGSTLAWPGVFGGERRVKLLGEAYFNVCKEDRPFVLETENYDVRVLGTEFNVEAYAGEFAVSLVEGSVRVDDVEIRPGERLRAENGRLILGVIPESEHFLWRDGLIEFERADLPRLMGLFEKYFGFEFEYESLPRVSLSGKIRISDGVDHALWVLRQNAEFSYEKNVDEMKITIKK